MSDAAADLHARFASRLVRLAGQHLSRTLAARLDGEDVVQSAFRTFFRRDAAGEFRVDGSAQLWRLLVTITLAKARAQGRRHTAGPRDAGAEVGADAIDAVMADEPGPAEVAAFADQVEALLHGLPPLYGDVLHLRLQGCGTGELAEKLGVSSRTVQRALNLLQQRLGRAGE